MDELERLGREADRLDDLAAIGFEPGSYATFQFLEAETRQRVLRQLNNPSERELQELRDHSNRNALAAWLLTLPAYFTAIDADGDGATD